MAKKADPGRPSGMSEVQTQSRDEYSANTPQLLRFHEVVGSLSKSSKKPTAPQASGGASGSRIGWKAQEGGVSISRAAMALAT